VKEARRPSKRSEPETNVFNRMPDIFNKIATIVGNADNRLVDFWDNPNVYPEIENNPHKSRPDGYLRLRDHCLRSLGAKNDKESTLLVDQIARKAGRRPKTGHERHSWADMLLGGEWKKTSNDSTQLAVSIERIIAYNIDAHFPYRIGNRCYGACRSSWDAILFDASLTRSLSKTL